VGEGLAARVAGACLVGGLGLLTAAETGWAHAIGVVLLLAFVVAGFLATVPAFLDAEPQT
jgi:cytochrome d ubiquinol oxidase subunit II